jgi:Peptidase family M48/Bacterial SH3 domain
MKKIVYLIVIIFVFSLCFAETGVVKRDRAIVRKGPGSLYEIKTELTKGAIFEIVEEKSGWYSINYNENCGFVSKKVTKERKQNQDIFSQMGRQQSDLTISQHGMSAGVKGFAERFTKAFNGAPDFFHYYSTYQLDAKEYKIFRKLTYKDFKLKKNKKKLSIPFNERKDYFSFSEEGMGIGIAAQIASLGLIRDRNLMTYLNQVGNIVVEATDVYDINFKFFILDTDKVNAYACPGGIVFITKGMLRLIRSEAELACVLAHEIAHIARHHGMLEMEERKNQIMAEDAFAEMEDEMEGFGIEQNEEMKAVEQEMEELSFQIFETLVNGRLEEYEEEADQLAVIFASRSGYNGKALLTLLNRLQINSSQTTNEHYTQDQITERITMVTTFLSQIDLPSNLFNKKARWKQRSGM